MNFPANELEWFPKWVAGYAAHRSVKPRIGSGGIFPVQYDLVVDYLRNLRDSHVEAWRRLQAARALEIYQATVARNSVVDFRPIRDKLREIERREKRAPAVQDYDPNLVAGEGNEGRIDETEPEVVQRMRATLRLLHYPKSTEDAYFVDVRIRVATQGMSYFAGQGYLF